MKERLKKCILLLAIGGGVNVALAIVKLYVGLSSNSLCILLDATNSLLDVLTGIVTVLAISAMFIPRSKNAPFGYGRSEYLAGFVVSVVAVFMGGLFFVRSLNRMAMPEPIWFGLQNCVLISVAVPVKLALGLCYLFCNKKLKSKAISAVALDSFLDVGITAASLVAFSISSTVEYAVDAIFGMVMSIAVVIFAVGMVVSNVKCIVKGDGAKDEELLVKKVCALRPEIKRVVAVTLHDYGFGAKTGVAEVIFSEGVTLSDAETLGEELHARLLEENRIDVRIVPRSDDSAPKDKERNENSDIAVNELL